MHQFYGIDTSERVLLLYVTHYDKVSHCPKPKLHNDFRLQPSYIDDPEIAKQESTGLRFLLPFYTLLNPDSDRVVLWCAFF